MRALLVAAVVLLLGLFSASARAAPGDCLPPWSAVPSPAPLVPGPFPDPFPPGDLHDLADDFLNHAPRSYANATYAWLGAWYAYVGGTACGSIP